MSESKFDPTFTLAEFDALTPAEQKAWSKGLMAHWAQETQRAEMLQDLKDVNLDRQDEERNDGYR